MINFSSEVLIASKASPAMPLLQCPGPAPDFATHAVVNGNIGHVALKDYQGEKKLSSWPLILASLRHKHFLLLL